MKERPKNLYEILKYLRAPNGCPWDREQTSLSLSTCMKEECAEVLEAIDLNDKDLLCEELGDLLMNIVFQAVIAEEEGYFNYEDVKRQVCEKLIRRHVHVFGEESASNPEEVLKLWDQVKSTEKKRYKRDSILSGLAPEIPALDYAEKIQKKVAKYKFDWENQEQIIDKIQEEFDELKLAIANKDEENIDEEIGDMLFVVSNLARFRKRSSSEILLRKSNQKFMNRFQFIENELKDMNIKLEDANLELLEKLYQKAKKCL